MATPARSSAALLPCRPQRAGATRDTRHTPATRSGEARSAGSALSCADQQERSSRPSQDKDSSATRSWQTHPGAWPAWPPGPGPCRRPSPGRTRRASLAAARLGGRGGLRAQQRGLRPLANSPRRPRPAWSPRRSRSSCGRSQRGQGERPQRNSTSSKWRLSVGTVSCAQRGRADGRALRRPRGPRQPGPVKPRRAA